MSPQEEEPNEFLVIKPATITDSDLRIATSLR